MSPIPRGIIRRSTLLWSALAICSALAVGVAILIVARDNKSSPQKLLIGRWQGEGKIHVTMSLGVEAEQNGGKQTATSGSVDSAVSLEFRPDGTYTWSQRDTGEGITVAVSVPDKTGQPVHWQLVRSKGTEATLRLSHLPLDLVVAFDGQDSFTLTYRDDPRISGTLRFQRVTPD